MFERYYDLNMKELSLAHEIVLNCGMSDRPEYTSGLNAKRTGFSSEKIFNVHAFIKEMLGEKPAEAFVSMVRDATSLSQTAFLNSLYALEESGWVISPTNDAGLKPNSEIDLESVDIPDGNICVAIGTIAGLLTDETTAAETLELKNGFLRKLELPLVSGSKREQYDSCMA